MLVFADRIQGWMHRYIWQGDISNSKIFIADRVRRLLWLGE